MKFLVLLLLCTLTLTAEVVNSYSVGKLSSSAIAAKVRERFKAQGEPLFLIHDSKKGVSVGDFIRFSDKMVLIDGQVWQTLAAEKALSNIKDISVTTLTGSVSSAEWQKKSTVVSSENGRKSYLLGAEILKIFEEQFVNSPKTESIVISFTGGRATLLVPDQLISSLKLNRVVKSTKQGEMEWTVPPVDLSYKNQPLLWQAWAADPGEPSGSISYSLSGALPSGLRWNSANHAIEGTPLQTGDFPLTISARSEKQRVTMNSILSVRENSAPIWANLPDTMRIGEDSLRFPLILSDYESPSRLLKLSVKHIPLGFSSTDSLRHLIWKPGDFPKPVKDSIVLSVSDPMGKSSTYSVPVYYDRDGVDVGYTFASLTPPWDTLVEGVTYRWNIAKEKQHWRSNHLEMVLGTCSDSTVLEDSVIILRPGIDSVFTVKLQFKDRERDVASYDVVIPVIRNRSPYFEAFPDKWDIEARELVYFTPKAVDPEGENVEVSLRSADSGFVWHEGRLSFSAMEPGTYQAFFEAKDSFGNSAVQQVSYYVKQIYDRYRGFKVETGIWPGKNSWNPNSWGFINPWRLHWDTPALRFGIFSPDDCNMFDGTKRNFRYPFFYVGTELVPPHRRIDGTSVVIDAGASYNITTSEIHTFGLMLNVEAKAFTQQLFNSQIDFRFLFFARHLLRKVAVNMTINDDGTMNYSAVKNIQLLEEFVSPNNINLMAGANQWFHLGGGTFIGPSFQMRAVPLAMEYSVKTVKKQEFAERAFPTTLSDSDSIVVTLDQSKNIYSSFAGLGIRYDLKISHFLWENKVRIGWGGQRYGVMAYWDTNIGFGRFKR